jgi:CheY-like chemotaxis protein
MRLRSVLVIDDDPDIRGAVVDLLHDHGFSTMAARDGRLALDLLDGVADSAQLPCVIVLDLMMPVMDGWTFRREQLRRAAWSAIPVIVISAMANSTNIDRGISEIVGKPFKGADLLASIARVC